MASVPLTNRTHNTTGENVYNIQISRVASEARANLAQQVTDAKRTAPQEEHGQIELAGQALFYALAGIDDDHLVEAQAHGSNVPSTGQRVFHINVSTREIRTKATDAATRPDVKPWTPAQGPLGALATATPTPTPGTVDTSVAATSPASPSATGTGTARAG